ncbi:Porphobilinogen synthase [hydrothermal vent metagenome]|uniref:Delta-aminolevulinic acid dehydratase n=1 Tax=hydrothermal vent metagenome TaxID=652676 RepID=A0A3B1CGI2_9ZZZZ
MKFPEYRARRTRASANIQRLVRENRLSTDMLIYPLFVQYGKGVKDEISSMPGNFRFSVDMLKEEVREVEKLGIPAVVLFGIPEEKDKDEAGSSAYDPDGIVQNAVREIKNACPDMVVITDVCIDEYTSHGHCGVVKDGKILNDPTLELLGRMALTHAQAGVDIVAPSDMMDGRIGAIRIALDDNGYKDVAIMSYAAKYASAFYGPFREACDSSPEFGDRSTYQMDPANALEAVREVALDIVENADIVMVKPALPYLDIIRMIRSQFNLPVAAYNVSGEYSMIEAAGRNGWIDRDRAMMESLLSIHRAGASMILTYFAKDAAKILNSR